MFPEVLIFMTFDVHTRLHAQDFHQKILPKKKKKPNKKRPILCFAPAHKKNKQKATKRTLIFQVIGPAHKIKLRRGIRIVYMHLIIHQRLFAIQTNPLLCSISETLFLLKRRLHCLVAASNNQVRF